MGMELNTLSGSAKDNQNVFQTWQPSVRDSNTIADTGTSELFPFDEDFHQLIFIGNSI